MSSTSPLDSTSSDELNRLRVRVTELEAERTEWEPTRADLHEQRELVEALREVVATLNSTLSLAEVFDRILTQLLRLIPYDVASVILLDDGLDPSGPRAACAVAEHIHIQLEAPLKTGSEPFDVDDLTYLKHMLLTGQAYVIPDVLSDGRWVSLPQTAWVHSWLGAPIRVKGRIIGFVSVKSATPNFFRAKQIDRLQVLTDQAAIAIDNARLFEETQQRLLEVEVLYESTRAMSELMTPVEIGQKIIELFVRKLNWHHSTIRLYHPEQDSLELLAFSQPQLRGETEARAVEQRFKTLITRPGQGLSGWVVEHGQTVRSGDVSNDPRYTETFPGLQSGLYVPLKIGELTLGVIGSAAGQYTVPGTGLNLAIAQAIMSKLGGKITVESDHGHGATFTIWVRPSV